MGTGSAKRRPRRTNHRLVLVATIALSCGALAAPGATAQQAPPTTPIPPPADPNQPPASQPPGEQQRVVADAGALLGAVRLLPRTNTPDTILDNPGFEDKLPKQSLAEFGFGSTSAQANSEAYFAHERASAEASPVRAGLGGASPRLPGSVVQNAVPDNHEPEVAGLRTLDPGTAASLDSPEGSAHARWDRERGPCHNPIADARLSLGGATAVRSLPVPNGADRDGPANLNGLLGNDKTPHTDAGPLVRLPKAAHVRSNVRLVNNPDTPGRAVRSTSQLGLGSVELFPGTDQQLQVDVLRQPTLAITATGDPRESTVQHEAPVLRVRKDNEEIGRIDAAHPTLDLPIDERAGQPVLGESSETPPINVGLVRLSIGELRQAQLKGSTAASSSLFDLRVLPNFPMKRAALAQVTFGQQSVRAGAPEGGVRCAPRSPRAAENTAEAEPHAVQPAAHRPNAGGNAPPQLARTNGSPYTVPLFFLGTSLLVIGFCVVAALPRRKE